MPDRDVEAIRDLIFYRHEKIIARSVFSTHDGKVANKERYAFTEQTFRQLKGGEMKQQVPSDT